MIEFDDFLKVDMRIGTIIAAADFPKARKPAYQLEIDFGPELGVRKSSAQITDFYDRENLIGKQVIAVVNFPTRQIANFFSEVLVLGAVQDAGVVLLQPEQSVVNGTRIS
ncbi:MAG: tRNA-binding protein [Saprospiraceae bacterium]